MAEPPPPHHTRPRAPPTTSFPLAAQPRREIFDPWNSSATGHQRAENRLSGSTSWRDSRSAKLGVQFGAGRGGGKRVADTVGAGSESFERGERTANGEWKRGVIRDRSGGQISLWESFGVSRREGSEGREAVSEGGGKRRRVETDVTRMVGEEEAALMPAEWQSSQQSVLSQESHMPSPPPEDDEAKEAEHSPSQASEPVSSSDSYDTALLNSVYGEAEEGEEDESLPPPSGQPLRRTRNHSACPEEQENSIALTTTKASTNHTPPPQVFRGLTIYINGSTYPTISDHKLKYLLVTHGANISIALGRRTVTHVILGHATGSGSGGGGDSSRGGAGGALAAGKIQKEIARMRSSGGKGVRFVSAEWVLACVGAGKRVAEKDFEVVRTGPVGVVGVHKVFGKAAK